jgi:carboxypeptidase C (cathepsin A)
MQGEGYASTIGNFFELGPFEIVCEKNKTCELVKNERRMFGFIADLLFIDGPVGIGGSSPADVKDLSANSDDYAKDLHAAL